MFQKNSFQNSQEGLLLLVVFPKIEWFEIITGFCDGFCIPAWTYQALYVHHWKVVGCRPIIFVENRINCTFVNHLHRYQNTNFYLCYTVSWEVPYFQQNLSGFFFITQTNIIFSKK